MKQLHKQLYLQLKTIETYTISYTSTVFGIMKQTTTIIEIVK
ncbi:MAG: hypothetical protein QXY23_04015 [Ignisphaera sp.]